MTLTTLAPYTSPMRDKLDRARCHDDEVRLLEAWIVSAYLGVHVDVHAGVLHLQLVPPEKPLMEP